MGSDRKREPEKERGRKREPEGGGRGVPGGGGGTDIGSVASSSDPLAMFHVKQVSQCSAILKQMFHVKHPKSETLQNASFLTLGQAVVQSS